MARKPRAIGPSTLDVIEQAPLEHFLALLRSRRNDTEPDCDLPDDLAADDVDVARSAIIERLDQMRPGDLLPLEDRCRRVLSLAEGKGSTSLDTVAEQRLDDAALTDLADEPDATCRSIRLFLHHPRAFEDAESFHSARQYRDIDRLYDALEVDLDVDVHLDTATLDEEALRASLADQLDLPEEFSLRTLDLPPSSNHPSSMMLVVRHGGQRSSVQNFRKGRRESIYIIPPNEVILIYTPDLRQIEVCADVPRLRQEVARVFAKSALNHDVSSKPLTWKRYNLGRFRESLVLPRPEIDGFDIAFARVIEAEVRLGNWSRKLALKVALEDQIQDVAHRYLGPDNLFGRADGFSRICIAVSYYRQGETEDRTLRINITGTRRCNLQSKRDPEERGLGYALLRKWGILTAFEPIDADDLSRMLPHLVALHELPDNEVTGAYLADRGLNARQLVRGGLLERADKQDVILIDEDDTGDREVKIGGRTAYGMAEATDIFGHHLGRRPADDLDRYSLNRDWLRETIIRHLKPVIDRHANTALDSDLHLIGEIDIVDTGVQVYLARRLDDVSVLDRAQRIMLAQGIAAPGIVLTTSRTSTGFLGPNVVVPILSTTEPGHDPRLIDQDALIGAFKSGRHLAMGGSAAAVLKYDQETASLHVPGKPPLMLTAANQIRIFERLVDAHNAGAPEMKTRVLMEGFGSTSPIQAFRKRIWASIVNVYITRGTTGRTWRLVV